MSTPAPRPWRLDECNLSMIREQGHSVAILPFGATEPHNLHLPYGTDTFEAEWIANSIAESAWKEGAKSLVLPTIPYGTETNLSAFPLAMNLMPSTILSLLKDLLYSLSQAGLRKVLLLNSHGGNDFKPLMRELYGQTPCHLFLCNWFQMVRDVTPSLFQHPDDHAGEMETSMILAYRPELVARNPDGSLSADDGQVRPFRWKALESGWVTLTRPWHLLTTNSGSGYPHLASAEKGRQLMDHIQQRLVPFLVDLAKTPIDDTFPFKGELEEKP